tara:strand:- start:538 stop:1659 length:1122 start_codon:yes stop_codon:yes gene_type:complete
MQKMQDNINTDKIFFTEWWNQINKPIFISVLLLIFIGSFISLTINQNNQYSITNNIFSVFSSQALFLIIGLTLCFLISTFDFEKIKTITIILFSLFFVLLFLTLVLGNEIKGSKRWIDLGYFTIMPIELIKPFFCLLLAFILSNKSGRTNVYFYILSFAIYVSISIILILQPDISQFILVSAIYFSAIFLSGFSFIILVSIVFLGIVIFLGIYLFNFNVQNRINSFFAPEQYDVTQAELSLRAIKSGGLVGVGPGNGVIKERIPEAESDYIFSVIAEEYGLIGCLMLLTIFFIIAYNGFRNVYNNNNHFIQIGLFSLVVYFCLQALIHIAVNIRLIPTTGITLPFISYGGSSILGMSVTCGFIMMFSKKRHNR